MWKPMIKEYTLKTGYTIYVCTNYDYEGKYVEILNSYVNGKHYSPTKPIRNKKKGKYFRFLNEEIFISEMRLVDKDRFLYDLKFDKEKINVDYLKAILLIEKYEQILSTIPTELMLIYPILTEEGVLNVDSNKETSFEEEYEEKIKTGERIYLPCRLDIKDYFYLDNMHMRLLVHGITYNKLVPVISNSSIVAEEKLELETIVNLIKEGHVKILNMNVRRW